MSKTQYQTEKLTFEKVWLMFQETDKKFQETDRQFKETSKKFLETEKFLDSLGKKQEALERKSSKKLSKLEELFTSQWGKLVESLVEGKLVELLKARGIDIEYTYTNLISESKDMEIDIVAANGKDVVVVEVKTTLKLDYIKEFIEKLDRFKEVFKRYNDNRIIGAVAFLKSDIGLIKYAKKEGLFVIRATGDSAKIVNEANFKPRAW